MTRCDLAEPHHCLGKTREVTLRDEFDGETVMWCATARSVNDDMVAEFELRQPEEALENARRYLGQAIDALQDADVPADLLERAEDLTGDVKDRVVER